MPAPSRPIPELAREIKPSDFEQLFQGIHCPCDRKQLVNFARERFATADILAVLDAIPNRAYQNVGDIYQAVQQLGQQTGRQQV